MCTAVLLPRLHCRRFRLPDPPPCDVRRRRGMGCCEKQLRTTAESGDRHRGDMMMPQLLILILGCQLICGTPAPTNDRNKPEQTATLQPSEMPEESTTLEQDSFQVPERVNVAQPVISISERVQVRPRDKKDLGTLGYVLGILMVVIIIAIGSGIIVGYVYKRGRDLKQKHDQEIEDRRLQRINLPLSAFSNPTCDIVDENTIEVSASHTPDTVQEGTVPLMDSAGTPGA